MASSADYFFAAMHHRAITEAMQREQQAQRFRLLGAPDEVAAKLAASFPDAGPGECVSIVTAWREAQEPVAEMVAAVVDEFFGGAAQKSCPAHDEQPPAAVSITVDEANAAAMKLANQDATFVHGGIRKWAAEIENATGKKCSTWTVEHMMLWKKTMEETGRGRKKGTRQPRPKAVSLSAAEREQRLRKLASEQGKDWEPSPLDDDLPDEKPLRVRHRKRV
jgi:hypothetical protein